MTSISPRNHQFEILSHLDKCSSRELRWTASGGANPNPIFTGMMAVNQLGELGLRPDGEHDDAAWSRPALVDPEPVAGMPHGLAVLPAAAAMLRWKLHGNDR